MTRATRWIFPVVILTSFLMVSCDDDFIEDSWFQAWCGDTLCDWMTEAGRIARVGTWHPSDYGVELLETPTVLSQVVATPSHVLTRLFQVSDMVLGEEECSLYGGQYSSETGECLVPESDWEAFCGMFAGLYVSDTGECLAPESRSVTSCMRFEVSADIADTAQVLLEIDFGANGSVDGSLPLVASGFDPSSFLLNVPNAPGVVRFRIHKQGEGRTVIAHFGVRMVEGCVTGVVADALELSVGAICEADRQCASNECTDIGSWQACSECRDDVDCDTGERCQVVLEDAPTRLAFRACRAEP